MVWNVDVSTHQKANHWTCWVKAEKRMQVRRAILLRRTAAHARRPKRLLPRAARPSLAPRALRIREVHPPGS